MSRILWRVLAAEPKKTPTLDDCVCLAYVDLPREAFTKARRDPRVAGMEKRGMRLYARGCTLGPCSTCWMEGRLGGGGRQLFSRDWAVVDATEGPVQISAVVVQTRASFEDPSVEGLRFDARVAVSSKLFGPAETILDQPDETAVMDWCERQAAFYLNELKENPV